MSYSPDAYDSDAFRRWHLALRRVQREHPRPFVMRIGGWTQHDPHGVCYRLGDAERMREVRYWLLCLDDGLFHHVSTIPEAEIEVIDLGC